MIDFEISTVASIDRPLAQARRVARRIGAELPPVLATLDEALERYDDRTRPR